MLIKLLELNYSKIGVISFIRIPNFKSFSINEVSLNIWDILIVAGAVQGLIVGTVLLFIKRQSPAGKTLAMILFATALASIAVVADGHPGTAAFYWLGIMERYMPFYLTMLIGPLIYLHVRSFLFKDLKFGAGEIRHFLPVLFNFIPPALNGFGPFFLQTDTIQQLLHDYYIYGDALFWIHLSTYLWLTSKLLKTHKHEVGRATYSRWLRQFIQYLVVFQLVWLPFLLVYISSFRHLIWEFGLSYYPVYLPLVVLTYWMGLKYLLTFSGRYSPHQNGISKLSAMEIETYTQELQKLMITEKAYLNPDLNVKDLADRIGIASKTISFLLNHHLHTNFNDFVNKYRVEATKEKLTDQTLNHLTIAAIALDSGFRSIATFQRAFKNTEGISPKAFKKNHANVAQIGI